MKKAKYILLQFLLLFPLVSNGQVYNGGRESASVKYGQIKTPVYTVVYPLEFRPEALRVVNFIDTIAPYVSYGFKSPYAKFPIILYTSDQQSNGMVSFMPARDEMIMTPPVEMTATPWMKQLAIHEYRHVAQMSQLYSNVFKYWRWFLGELSNSVALALISKWYLEGDAVNAETQLTEYGRGLQPSFTIEYRAMMTDEAERPFNKWYLDNITLGSYRYHSPDKYKFGYQMVRAFETKLSPTYVQEFFDFATRRPYLISPSFFFVKKHTGKDMRHFYIETFRELDSLWRPLSAMDNNYSYFTKPDRSYTTYSYPISRGNGSYVALKETMDDPREFVMTDGSKKKHIVYPGQLSSRPVLRDSTLYWTEYKPGVLYEYKNKSVIRSINLSNRHRKSVHRKESNYLLTALPSGWAMVRYDSLLHGGIYLTDEDFSDTDTICFSSPTSFHGLAYDSLTSKLCFIAVDDRGMWIGAVDSLGTIKTLREPSAVTLSDLSAGKGKLYFGSIQSGKDEIHSIDLTTGAEYRLTTSKLGAKQPSADGDSVVFAGYSVKGWNLARASSDTVDSMRVGWQRLPNDILNPKRISWATARAFDTLKMDTAFSDSTKIMKRYRRASKWMNVHSWVPGIAANVDKILDEYSIEMGIGATALFQSPLGDMEGYVSLGSKNSMFWGNARLDYLGLPVKFGLDADYGGGTSRSYYTDDMEYSEEKYGNPGYHARVDVNAYLPINLSSYSVTRYLTPLIDYSRSADRIYESESDEFISGLDIWEANLSYTSYRNYSKRSMNPRFGVSLKVGVRGALHYNFAKVFYSKCVFYLPGFMKNHNIVLNGSTQYQNLADYNFSVKVQTPTGISDDNIYQKYNCIKSRYEFPIFYPDFGWDRYILFKRLSAQLFYDYSIGIFNKEIERNNVYDHSYGVALGIDFSLFSTGNQYLQLKVAFPNSERTFVGMVFDMTF